MNNYEFISDEELFEMMVQQSRDSLIEEAQILRIDDDFAWFDVQSKFEAPIPLSDWRDDEESPKIGDKHSLFIEEPLMVDDRPLTAERVCVHSDPPLFDWAEILKGIKVGTTHVGTIVLTIEGGFIVSLQSMFIHAFLPFDDDDTSSEKKSQAADKQGRKVKVQIASVDSERREVTVRLIRELP